MNSYALLLRGINVGGKNKIPMAKLRDCLSELGLENVHTYIASGNAIAQSDRSSQQVRKLVEEALPQAFDLDTDLVKVLVLSQDELQAIVEDRPLGFGEKPDTFHSDAIFLIDVAAADAMAVFKPREGVDQVWQGNAVIYSQRLSAQRTKSRMNTIVISPLYSSMTIRNWNTTRKLLAMMQS